MTLHYKNPVHQGAEFVLDERGESVLRIYGPTTENTL